MPAIEDAARLALVQRGRKLEYLTLGWNTLEWLVAIAAGSIAGSVSLTAFGLDSVIELTSGAALLWRMSVDSNEELRGATRRARYESSALAF